MSTLRIFVKNIAAFLLFVALLILPLVMSIQAVVNSPETIKGLLAQSKLYETPVETELLLEGSRLSSSVLSDPGIVSALNAAIPPSYIKSSSEKLIDNVYAYIHGRAASLELSVDISDAKARFADNVADYAKQKFEALPPCRELKIPSTSIESLLEATCAPIGVSSQQAGEYARSQIMNAALFSNDRLEITGLTGVRESLVGAYLADVRSAYPYFAALVCILPALGIVMAAGVLFLSSTRRRGAKVIGNILLSTGLINIFVAFITMWVLGFIVGEGMQSGLSMTESLSDVALKITDNMRAWWLATAGILVVVSIVIYFILRSTRQTKSGVYI